MADDTPFMGSLTKEDLDLAREVGIDTSKYTPESALTREGYRPVEQADYETSWSDYGRAITSGGAGVVSGLAGGAEYLTGGALGGDTRRYFGEISDEQVKAMSPAGRRAIQSEFLPGAGETSVFDNFASSLGLKTVAALPSMVASIIPAGIAVKALQGASLGARVLGAGVATRGTAGFMAGGDVAGQIYSEVEKLSDKDLQAKSELYAGYRSMMPEADARRQFMQEVAGAAPAAAALISAAIGGAEGQVAGRLAGKAATGVLRGIRSGAAHEAAQETAESGIGELLAQLALTDQNLAQMNWQKILSKGLEGATIGGIMGGGVGGISGIGGRSDETAPAPPAPPAATLKVSDDPNAITRIMEAEKAAEAESQGVVPPKGYGTGTAPAPAEDPTAGNPQSAPSGSETQYPKGKTPPFTIDTVRSRLEAKGIEFPEDRLQEIEGRISEIRKMKVGKRGAEYSALLKSLYPAETTVVAQTIAPGLQVGEGLDPAQLAAVQVANPVQPVQAPPSVMAPPTPAPVADALGNLTTPRAPAPAPAPAPARGPEVPAPVAAAVGRRPTQAPVDTGTNLQQPAADLLAEQEELISGQRAVQMFPTNTTPLKLPKGMKKSKTSRGVFHYNPDAMLPNGSKVTEGLIQRLSAMGRENELLGLGDRTKQEVAAAAPVEGGVTTVNEVTPAGDTVKSVATTVADADRQAQMLSENAAPENKVEIKPTEQALGPRVLRDVSEAGQAADAAQAEADAAAAARVAGEEKVRQAKAASEARAETVEGKVGTEAMLTKDQQRAAKVVEDEKAATEVVAGNAPTKAEAGLDSKNGGERQAAMQAMYSRLQNMVKAAEQRGVKIPERIRKQADDLVLLARAKKFLDARAPAAAKGGLGTVKPYQDFVAAEMALRGGREAAASERSRAKAEMETAAAKFAPAEEEKAATSEESGMLSQSAEEMAMTPEQRMIAAEEVDEPRTEAEAYAEGRERPQLFKARAAAAAAEAAVTSQEGKFKVSKRPKFEGGRPTVTGKVSLSRTPKAAAAVSAAQRTDVIESSNADMNVGWADGYAGLDPNRNIIYSDDTIALMSARAQNGKTIYVPIHRTAGVARVDIDAFTGKIFTQEQIDRLKAAKQADVDLMEAGRPANAIKFPNGEYIVPESTISLAEALNGLDLTGLSDTFSIIRDRVIRDVRNVPVHIVSPAEIAKASGRSTDLGFYSYSDATGEHILIRNDLGADTNIHTVVHEAVHALVMRSMKNNVTLNNLAVAVANEVTAYWKSKNGIDIRDMPFARYAYKNIDEFMSEAWGNREFQDLLAKTPISPTLAARLGIADWRKSTMWDAVIKFVQRTLKLPNNAVSALEAVMRVTDEAASGRAGLKPATGQAAPLQSANITAQGIIGSSADRKNAFTSWSKRNWAKFITGGQMRQQYADTVIGPALAKIWEGVSATGPRIQQIKAEGDALATTAIDLSKKNPTEFRSLVQIMEEARMMNVNIEGANAHLGKDATKGWQAKGRLGDLQSRFAQIRDGELKQLYRDMAAYYRDSHNAIVKSSVTSILEGLELRQARGKAKGNALTEQQIADLTKRVMDQEMTAADKALLGVTVFNALKNAAAFHRIQGDYFPLMRYGDHVVTTTDKIRDTMGGKLEEPDTVLFRDKSNTNSRRAAENFVKKSELVHLSTEKVFIDNATGKEVSEDDAKSLNDVDIGYRVTMQTKGVYFFETGKAAQEFTRTNPEGHDTVSNPEIRMGSGYQAQIMTGTQVASLNSAIDGRVKTGDITDGQAALLKSIVNQAATRMLGGNRIASRRLKSQKVAGASSDVARNLLQYNSAAANHIAVAENAPAIRDGLTEMTEALKGYAGNDRAQLVAVAEEVKARVDQGIVDPNAPGKVMKDIMALSFLARLFSPAYNVINGMQPWMVTLPILGGRFGNVAASAAMGRAYSDIGFGDAALQGVMNTARATQQAFKAALIGTDDIVGNIRKKVAKADDGADLTRMMDELIRLNAIDITAGFEVAASAAEGRGTYGKTLAGVDRIARQLPQVVEAVNRSVSAIASYRLARQNGQTHEQATQFALNTVQNTQGDYSAANAPRFFNNPILRPALQFKKYAQMMTYLLGDMAYRTFNGATPEERRIALKQIGNILSVQVLAAGALSLPGLEIIKAGFLIASMLGIGGGWDEQEEKLRKLLDSAVGKGWGEMISSGLLSRAFGNGVDLSQRMSLADMWLFGEPKGDSSESIQAYLFKQVVGAPGSLLLDARDGFAMALEGEFGKAAGKLIPIKFAADFAKAAHNYSESKYEEPEKRKVSGLGEAAFNVFGFRTGRQAELGRAVGASIKEKQDTQKEFKKLQKSFYNARTKGDQIKAIARNREWNETLSKAQWRLRLPVTPRELRTAQ